jgi:hypothetical protein
MKIINQLCILIIANVSFGCANINEFESEVKNTPVESRAHLIGVFSVECRKFKGILQKTSSCNQQFNSISTYVVKSDPNKDKISGFRLNSTFGSFGDDTKFDFESIVDSQGEKGFYFCKEILPGEYSVRGLDFTNFAGGGSGYSTREGQSFDFKFSALPGDIVVLGNIRISTTQGKNLIGIPITGPGYLEVLTIDSNDIKMAAAKCNSSVDLRPLGKPVITVDSLKGQKLVRVGEMGLRRVLSNVAGPDK